MAGSIRKLVHLGPMITALSFIVLDCDVPVIVGVPFLMTVNPMVNWAQCTVKVRTFKGIEPLLLVE